MGKEMDFDNWDFDYEVKTAIIMYDEHEELIQRLTAENLSNVSIDYKKKVFHAEYVGDGCNGIKNGETFDIKFYKMVII